MIKNSSKYSYIIFPETHVKKKTLWPFFMDGVSDVAEVEPIYIAGPSSGILTAGFKLILLALPIFIFSFLKRIQKKSAK